MGFLEEQLSQLILLGSTVVLAGAALVELGKDGSKARSLEQNLGLNEGWKNLSFLENNT